LDFYPLFLNENLYICRELNSESEWHSPDYLFGDDVKILVTNTDIVQNLFPGSGILSNIAMPDITGAPTGVEISLTNLAVNAIAFNKGTTDPVGSITTDFYDNARKVYSATDIGAYEFQTASDITNNLVPTTNSLAQNYPNPFNPATTINFALAKESTVNLAVYNIKGELVQSLINSNLKAGYHSVNFNGVGLNSGVYIYKMTTPEQSFVKKMIMVK